MLDYKKKWDIQDSKIDATYKLKFSVEEFPHDHLDKEKTRKEVEEFLSKELTKDFNKVIKKLQEAKSDAVGFGRTVRAFHPNLWNKGKWQDTFSELDINVKVEGGNYTDRHTELNSIKPASLFASRVFIFIEFLFLNIDESYCQRDRTDSQSCNKTNPVSVWTKISKRRHQITNW